MVNRSQMMTKRQVPDRETILNIIAAGGWKYTITKLGMHVLISPEDFQFAVPEVAGEPPHISAWNMYETFHSFDRLST